SACRTVAAPGIDLSGLGVPLTAGALTAATFSGGEREQQKALAIGGLANLQLAQLPALQLPDLSTLIPAELKTVHVDLSALSLLLTPLGLPTSIDVGLEAAIKDLIQPLPDVSVLRVGAATAYAGAACKDGRAVPFSTHQLADVSVLGQSLGADGLLEGALQVLDGQSIDLSQLDVSKLVLPKVISDLGLSALTQPLLTQIQGLVSGVLANLPPIAIPAQVASVSIKPGEKTQAGGVLTQHALDVHVELLGQTLIDGTIGEARVATADVDCTPASTPKDATELTLQCTTRKLVLTDVYRRDDVVRLLGVADKTLAGRTVAIRFEADGSTVARTTVKSDGSFAATAPLPPRKLRDSNRARYRASVGDERSLNLKLARRMIVSEMRYLNGKVTISGRVIGPLGRPIRPIQVQRRVSCQRNETVRSFLPKSDGTFSVTVPAPTGQTAAVYRLATKVRKNERNPKLYPTFTLPRGVNLQ
ncbi:MAG TPA: hypothetical protein VFZ89_12670, partial [Solirubrobacteraceae bacterium]